MIRLRKLMPYILSWCFCATLTARTAKVDSLIQALDSIKGNNLKKGLLMLDISNEYLFEDTAKSRMYVMEALRLAQKTGHEKLERDAYWTLGYFYQFFAEQPYLAYVNYKSLEKIYLKNNDKNRLCGLYTNMMTLFYTIDDMDNVVYYADKILEIAAERYDLTSLTPKDVSSDTINIVSDKPYDLTSLLFGAQFYKGVARYKENMGQEALDYFLDMFRKSMLMDAKYNYPYFVATQCAKIYIQQNRLREALYYLHWIHENFETGEEPGNIHETYASLAEAYAMLHRTDSAEYYMKKAREANIMLDGTKLILYRSRSLIDSDKGNYRSALENYKKYHHLYDSLANAGKTTEIAQMKNWYELEQKDNETQLLLQEKQKQHKLILVLTTTLVMILMLFALSVFFFRKTAEKNRELIELHGIKDKLFSVVAHDLRSPISSLISILRLVNENMLDADIQARLFKEISNRVDDTFGLLDNLLRWAKNQMQGIVPAPAYFDVREASREITDTLQDVAANKKIILDNSIRQQQVYADRDMFAVVVRNLTMNAIKYTSANGEITLDSYLSGNMLVVSVNDTGTGISEKIQKTLFKLSETSSQRGTNNENGAGLGLALCDDFVKANGGSIWFHSNPGEGSTFYFSIPVSD